MSHQPHRPEKDCLNCGALVQDRFCTVCGQENIVTHQSFWSLTKHFVYDIFHFDGKFWDTLRFLLFRPGFVPREYVQGRRMRYLDPIRMYLFTSALFFLIFFSITETDFSVFNEDAQLTKGDRFELASAIYHNPGSAPDSLRSRQLQFLLNPLVQLKRVSDSSDAEDSLFRVQLRDSSFLLAVRTADDDLDSIRFVGNRDDNNWMNRRMDERWARYKAKFDGDGNAMFRDFGNKLLHRFPYLLFVSLPFFALLLKLLYLRRKEFVYSDHAIFTLYHYILSFLLLLFFLAFSKLGDLTGLGFFNVLGGLLFPLWAVYLLIALKRFYGQGWFKTGVKFLFLNLAGLAGMFVLALIFILLSVFQL